MKKYFLKLTALITAIGLIFFILPTSAFATTDTFTVTGSWVAPAGVTSVTVDVWAGGGGGSQGSSGGSTGNGGGGGAFSEQTAISVTPGNSYTVTVGLGGQGGVIFGVSSTAGGDSWFSTTGTVLAKGGGAAGGPGIGGAAASGIGTTKFSGGNGANGDGITLGGGGGGGGGTTGNGATAVLSAGGLGTSVGGGNGGNGLGSGGSPGLVKGGGGGGGASSGDGSAGARGEVQITYTASNTQNHSAVVINNAANIFIGNQGNVVIK